METTTQASSDLDQPGGPAAKPSTRRRFINSMGKLLLGLWGVGIVAGLTRFLRPDTRHHEAHDYIVVAEDEIRQLGVGQVMLVPHSSEPLHLIRLGTEEFIALSAICTHLRCILEFDAGNRIFICPCHEGQFDLNGNVLAGLPTVPLPKHNAAYRYGKVIIQRS